MSILFRTISCVCVLVVAVLAVKNGFSASEENSANESQTTTEQNEKPLTVTARKVVAPVQETKQQKPNPDSNSEKSILLLYSYLNDAKKVQAERPHYTARLERHVFADDELQDPETIFVKVRQQPFSVYMKWESDGQEVLYVDGENENRLIARPTSGLAALRDIWHLTPDSPHAMKGCRYPLTELGIDKLHHRILEFYDDRPTRAGVTSEHQEELLNDRPVMVFNVTFHSPEECTDYSSSRIIFDALGKWIVGVENYGWTSDGRPGDLVEKYIYHDIDFKAQLTDEDFSIKNPEYKFAKN